MQRAFDTFSVQSLPVSMVPLSNMAAATKAYYAQRGSDGKGGPSSDLWANFNHVLYSADDPRGERRSCKPISVGMDYKAWENTQSA